MQVAHWIIPGIVMATQTEAIAHPSTTVAIATTANDISEVYPNRTHCIPDYCTVAIVTTAEGMFMSIQKHSRPTDIYANFLPGFQSYIMQLLV